MLLMVSIGHALYSSGLEYQRSQLLPTENTSSIGLKSGEYGGKRSTKTPAALTLANATPS